MICSSKHILISCLSCVLSTSLIASDGGDISKDELFDLFKAEPKSYSSKGEEMLPTPSSLEKLEVRAIGYSSVNGLKKALVKVKNASSFFRSYHVGDMLDNYKIKDIKPRYIVLQQNNQTQNIYFSNMKEESYENIK